MTQVERNEIKMDAKIDMLHRAGALMKPVLSPQSQDEMDAEMDDNDDDEEVDTNLVSLHSPQKIILVLMAPV